ncbi:MAG: hypothetical protein JWM63_2162 [Gammaproteobacteria bacterium]|jgi:hypothetical protein|nr:hypothetical protein [Gammaproteobacteria bacterium]
MKHSSRIGSVLGAALGIALLARSVTMPAFAALGEDAASIENDRARMKGQSRLTSVAGYSVQEIQLPSGTIVREYVAPGGKVFAVSWQGPVIPDLQQTLGTYFEQYKAAAGASRGGHHHLTVRQPGLVAHAGGHMRAWSGQAYVPGLLPPNFSVDDIK